MASVYTILNSTTLESNMSARLFSWNKPFTPNFSMLSLLVCSKVRRLICAASLSTRPCQCLLPRDQILISNIAEERSLI